MATDFTLGMTIQMKLSWTELPWRTKMTWTSILRRSWARARTCSSLARKSKKGSILLTTRTMIMLRWLMILRRKCMWDRSGLPQWSRMKTPPQLTSISWYQLSQKSQRRSKLWWPEPKWLTPFSGLTKMISIFHACPYKTWIFKPRAWIWRIRVTCSIRLSTRLRKKMLRLMIQLLFQCQSSSREMIRLSRLTTRCWILKICSSRLKI